MRMSDDEKFIFNHHSRDVRPRGLASASRPKNLASASASASFVGWPRPRPRPRGVWPRPRGFWPRASRPLEAYSRNGTECDWK